MPKPEEQHNVHMPIMYTDDRLPGWPANVPIKFLEAHRTQADINHQQTLERLSQRGGLDPSEMLAVLEDRRWERIEDKEAMPIILAKLAAFQAGIVPD